MHSGSCTHIVPCTNVCSQLDHSVQQSGPVVLDCIHQWCHTRHLRTTTININKKPTAALAGHYVFCELGNCHQVKYVLRVHVYIYMSKKVKKSKAIPVTARGGL
jgi:hypothetical protein